MSQYFRLCFAILVLSRSLAFAQVLPTAQNAIQAPFPTGAPTAQAPGTTIKLQVVLSKYDGDKKLSSLPYTLSLVPGKSGSLRTGAEVPVPTTTTTTADKPATTAYTLQQIGTQIDATVTPTSDGKYNLQLTVTDRFTGAPDPQSRVPNVPSFRNVVVASQAILANAETMQFTTAPTPSSNEVFKVDVTLTVGNK